MHTAYRPTRRRHVLLFYSLQLCRDSFSIPPPTDTMRKMHWYETQCFFFEKTKLLFCCMKARALPLCCIVYIANPIIKYEINEHIKRENFICSFVIIFSRKWTDNNNKKTFFFALLSFITSRRDCFDLSQSFLLFFDIINVFTRLLWFGAS